MKNETMYFNDLLSIWLEKQKQARALSTYVKYRASADRYISPYFRSIQLSKVDLPPASRHSAIPFIPGFPASAWERNYPLVFFCSSTPFCVFPMKPGRQTAFSISRPVFQKRPEVAVFTLQEQEQLEHYLTAHTGVSEAVIYLGLYTGAAGWRTLRPALGKYPFFRSISPCPTHGTAPDAP